ncbi:MAG: hypothetical protein GTO18_13585 [Anaerolineales bacterium]|nr:hypothetical protein [Anaerolineales bacterium]
MIDVAYAHGVPIYRVELYTSISKYIGGTVITLSARLTPLRRAEQYSFLMKPTLLTASAFMGKIRTTDMRTLT